jgi:hypothetical protein
MESEIMTEPKKMFDLTLLCAQIGSVIRTLGPTPRVWQRRPLALRDGIWRRDKKREKRVIEGTSSRMGASDWFG